jgi:acetolactate synthase-1/2/3 large subunit
MVDQKAITSDPRWSERPADDWADAIVASMKLGGVDHFFFVSGSELAFYQEAVAKAGQRGWPTPKLITVTHEGAAINAALGASMVTGNPTATAAHVDVGTFNYGGGLHTAWRGSYPVLITGGAGPRAYPGSMPGSRASNVQWVQEPRDQAEIVRQYTKMDHRMEHQDNPGLMVSRLLQVAMSEPKGPVYMVVPQETAKLPFAGTTRFPTRDELGVAKPAWPDPSDAKLVAQWLIKADNPLVVLGQSGRIEDSVEEIVRLAELLGLAVEDSGRIYRLNFPMTHPQYGTGASASEADVVVVLETPVPWMPPHESPKADTKIVWVDADPVQSRYKTMEFSADMWLSVSTTSFAKAVYEAATAQLSKSDMDRIADRKARMATKKREIAEANEKKALDVSTRFPIHPRWVAHEVAAVMSPDTILLDDTLGGSPMRAYAARSNSGTYFKSGGSSGGWGTGAAFGAKMAKPDSDVILTSGDGYYMFGSPLAGLWAAGHYKAGFLSVVMVNGSYSTGTSGLAAQYPDGAAVGAGNYEGGTFVPPPNFAKLGEAANGYGEEVSDPAEIRGALQRGLEQARDGVPAVIAINLPTIPEEMGR